MAVLLDTNVVSEAVRESPDQKVATWILGYSPQYLFFSAIGEAELRYGLAIMASGRRQRALLEDVEQLLRETLHDRILPFDSDAARAYSDIAASCRIAGRPVPRMDRQIAAIARSRGMAMATRNVRDFENMGVELVNPWTDT